MRKKGFTLIELLAVIVVLAIIAIIAVPQITKVIETSRQGSAESSALGYIDAVEKYIVMHEVNSSQYPTDLQNGVTYQVGSVTGIKVKGKAPDYGVIKISEKKTVEGAMLKIGNYNVCCTDNVCKVGNCEFTCSLNCDSDNDGNPDKNIDSNNDGVCDSECESNTETGTNPSVCAGVTNCVVYNRDKVCEATNDCGDSSSGSESGSNSSSGSESGSNTPSVSGPTKDLSDIYSSASVKQLGVKGVVYLNPADLTELCNESNSVSTTGTKIGCMKWYIFDDSGDNYTIILDHNTTATVAYNSNASSSNTNMGEVGTALETDTAQWANSIKATARLITANEIATITNTSSFTGSDGTNFFFNGSGNKKQTKVSSSQGDNEYAWLFDYTKSCTSFGCNTADSSTKGYWTSSLPTGIWWNVWSVTSSGDLNNTSIDLSGSRGVRPVITISKTLVS